MIRNLAAIVVGLAVVACVPSLPPTTTASPGSAAAVTSRPLASDSPSQDIAANCIPFDLDRQTQPYVFLHRADDPEAQAAYGLNGDHILGDRRSVEGGWHQPSPGAAYAIDRGERLQLTAFLDEEGERNCLRSVAIEASAFSPGAVAPTPGEIVWLASFPSSDTEVAAFSFLAPSLPGEWVLRARLGFTTAPGPSSQEAFFRLRVDEPAPVIKGTATRPVACGAPGDLPPAVDLSVDGGAWVPGERGSFTWNGLSSDGGPPLGPLVEAGSDAQITMRIGGDACAGWWRIELAPEPPTERDNLEPITDLVTDTILAYGTPADAVNRFRLDEIPPGRWVVRAEVWFARTGGDLLGQTTSHWNVVVR